MKRWLAIAIALAFWTGRSEYVTTITNRPGINCEYDYVGQKFWRTFVGGICPMHVEVE